MGHAESADTVETFIRRRQGLEGGQERANYVSFLNELIAVFGLPKPDLAGRYGPLQRPGTAARRTSSMSMTAPFSTTALC